MRLALSEISTMPASFQEDVRAYGRAGFDGIGVWESKLGEDDDANVAVLRDSGLSVANMVPEVPAVLQLAIPGMEGPADPEERIAALGASIRRFAHYEPECVLFLAGTLGGRDMGEGRRILVDAIRRLAADAREVGVRLGFETSHPSQREVTSFVNSLGEADAILAEAGTPEVGIVVDTYQLWDDPAADAWIDANAGRVVGIHVSDRPEDRSRTDRLLPGEEGSTRSRELIRRLVAAGSDAAVEVEIFSTPDRFWRLPVDEAARRAYAAALWVADQQEVSA